MPRLVVWIAIGFLGVLALRMGWADEDPSETKGTVSHAWRPIPEPPGERCRFVVLADTHASPGHPQNLRVARTVLAEAERLGASFAVFVGDLVNGYVPDRAVLEANWAAFDELAAASGLPYRVVAGNNDIYDAQSLQVWGKRYGCSHHAFRVGSNHFLCLNGENLRAPGRLDAGQLAWLEEEMKRAKDASHLFVFVHQPHWRAEPGQSNWMSDVHPLLAAHPSAHVFAGHWHHYEKGETRDGVEYRITTAAGGPVRRVEEAGEFHGYLLVDVVDKDVRVSVIRAGHVLPDTVVGEKRVAELRSLRLGLVVKPLQMGDVAGAEIEGEAVVKNVLSAPLEIDVSASAPDDSGWRVEPASRQFVLEPGQTQTAHFRVTRGEALIPGPVLRIFGRSEGKIVLDQESPWPLAVQRRLEVVRVAKAPEVDGELDEAAWAAAPAAGRFLTLAGDAYAERGTDLRALWDDKHLYVAFRLEEPSLGELVTNATDRDWSAITDDAVVMYLDVERDGRSTYCFGVNAAGVPMEYRAPGGAPDLMWNGPWQVAVGRGESEWTIEAAIPWESLSFTPEAEKTFAVGAYRHSLPGGRALTGWTPPQGGRLSNPAAFGVAALRAAE